MAWKLFILIGACNVFFCSKTTPSSKCLSIWLSICLFIPFFITITSSSFLWSLRDVQIGILYKYVSIWYDCLSYIYLSVYISIYNLFIYLYLSFHSFIYWIIINTFLLTTSRCLSILLSLWLHNYLSSPATARKICLYIQQFIYLSMSSNKFIYLHVYQSIYFSKEHFWDTLYYYLFPCMLFVCPLSQLACWGLMLLKALVYLLVCKGG